MLLFSTLLSIKDTMTEEDFIRSVIDWNKTSPHEKNIIKDIEWNGERNVRFGSDKLWLGIEAYPEGDIIAVRYEKIEDDGAVWDTDYVMNFKERKMSVRLDRSYLEEALTTDPKFSTPHFISMLIERGYIDDDNGLPVLREPHILKEEDLGLIASVINGESDYDLPVVYVSKTFMGRDPLDTGFLSARLKGVAHVMTEESESLTYKLRKLCDDRNEYNGAVGVYFPNTAYGHRKFLNHDYYDSDRVMMEKVIDSVIKYSISQMMDPMYTWTGVNSAILMDRYSTQRAETLRERFEKEKTLRETDDLLQSFDCELDDMRKRIEELTKQNDALLYENQGLRVKLSSMNDIPLLSFGDEDEFFRDEIREIVLEKLEDALKATEGNTRRADILGDIVRSNGGCKGTTREKSEYVKKLFKGYRTMSSGLRQKLKDLGFEITEDGKHYKLTYYGDSRYSTTVSKTAGDNRTGINVAMTIIRNML